MERKIDALWKQNYAYACAQGYSRTCRALEYMKSASYPQVPGKEAPEYRIHGLALSWLLIELRLPIPAEALDRMLAASVLHIFPELYGEEGMAGLTAGEDVVDFVRRIRQADREPGLTAEDPLLLMIKLAERSNLIEHLCDMSTDDARHFMQDAKRVWFPVCLEGRLRFPEFSDALTGLLEKMRGLIQVMDILFKRYDTEEEELYDEILTLREENASIRLTMDQRRQSR